MDDKAPPDHRRSRPWGDDELMRVDGFKACYSTKLGSIHLVRCLGALLAPWPICCQRAVLL